MTKNIIPFLIFLITTLSAFSQSTVDVKIQLLTNDAIGDVTLDKEPFFEWVKSMNEEFVKSLEKIEGNKDVVALFTLHKNADVEISISARPEMPPVVLEALKANISKIKAPNTKISDYSFLFFAAINDGANEDLDFKPTIILPQEKEIKSFEQLTLEDKKKKLQQWSTEELIPLLGALESKVDPQFAGVMNFGKMVSAKSFLNKNTNDYTGKNPDYWRANIEMELGNLLIPFTKVCMYISNGEFDKAERLLFIVNYFSAEGTLPDYLSREISAKLGLLKSEIEAEINQGIKLHDQGLYTEAVALYENLLTSFPKCAWLNYELYFSKVGAENNEDKRVEEWYKIKPIVYECDPMYPMDINATNGTQSYLMFSRNEIGSLFQSKETANKDFVRYADIALDLGNYEFAAQLYWLIIGNISKEEYDNRDMLAHFLYCLDKLGDKEMIKNFKGDYKKEFAKIEKERKKIMEKSTYYKMMK